jgi:membrane protease YdiL (CAAX protease family)
MWLRDIAGPAGAVLLLGIAGALTGLLYLRTRNVLGMMAGHWLLNLLLAAAAVIYMG